MTNIILIIFSLALPTVVGGKTAKRVAAEGEVTIFSIIIDTKGKEACGEVIKINYYKSSFTLYAFHCVDLLTKHIAINTWWVHFKKSRGRRHGWGPDENNHGSRWQLLTKKHRPPGKISPKVKGHILFHLNQPDWYIYNFSRHGHAAQAATCVVMGKVIVTATVTAKKVIFFLYQKEMREKGVSIWNPTPRSLLREQQLQEAGDQPAKRKLDHGLLWAECWNNNHSRLGDECGHKCWPGHRYNNQHQAFWTWYWRLLGWRRLLYSGEPVPGEDGGLWQRQWLPWRSCLQGDG